MTTPRNPDHTPASRWEVLTLPEIGHDLAMQGDRRYHRLPDELTLSPAESASLVAELVRLQRGAA